MKFYLIDKNKVRSIFESGIVNGKVTPTYNNNFSVSIYDVNYEISRLSLDVIYAEPISDHAYALTTEGLVSWKNQYRKITTDEDDNKDSSAKISDFNNVLLTDVFCSGYICLGKTPSPDAFKINTNDFKVFDIINNEIKSPDDVGLKITETENSIIIEKKKRKKREVYDIGLVIKDKLYVITDFSNDLRSMKETIPKGTCFATYVVVNMTKENEPIRETEQTPRELCY